MSHYLTSDEIVAMAHAPETSDEEWTRRVCLPICRGVVMTIRGIDRDTADDLVAVGVAATWRARSKVMAGAQAFNYLTKIAKRDMLHELDRLRRLDRLRARLCEQQEETR